MSFSDLFHRATQNKPFSYQERLAAQETLPQLLAAATGLGKTAAIVLAWLWHRRFAPREVREATPRRLVYFLPMRVLVEQTFAAVVRWLDKLGMLAGEAVWVDSDQTPILQRYHPQPELEDLPDGSWGKGHGASGAPIAVHLLLGGEPRTDWAVWPERDAILIGTQDMLLSRALNRGYASGRARWPREFGLLTNDCLWVMDEVQLMGSGFSTTAQFDAFLNGGKQTGGFGCFGNCRFLWMSATIEPRWLETVDYSVPAEAPFGLLPQEKASREGDIGRRLHAKKLRRPTTATLQDKPVDLAREILDTHRAANQGETEPSMTLVVVNTVNRAVALHQEIAKLTNKEKLEEPLLIHSRFRPPDRQRQIERLLGARSAEGRIVVATQVVEAGMDISAKVLFTELAPWASLVQRFGRCNRKGEYAAAQVFWIDLSEKQAPPYLDEDLTIARQLLVSDGLSEVGPAALESFLAAQPPEVVSQLLVYRPGSVIRRKDLLDLFDTTPDLAGNDIDVSRYIRDTDDHDVQVFWRTIPQGETRERLDEEPGRREELCAVPVGDFADFVVRNAGRVWRWDFLDSRWVAAHKQHVYAGQMFLVACDAGGYSPETGWHGKDTKQPVEEIPPPENHKPKSPEGNDDDLPSQSSAWASIANHTQAVCRELETIVASLSNELPVVALQQAARWHDRGKAHQAFVAKLKKDSLLRAEAQAILSQPGGKIAKAPDECWRPRIAWGASEEGADGWRRHFRHELASALAVLQAGETLVSGELRDLVAYLIAAHHGKVRLSLRSMPDEFHPSDRRVRFARGIWEGDRLPLTDLGGGLSAPEVTLSLEPMELGLSADGQPSWAERMLRLRNDPHLGPFRLAYLEAILRAADGRASAKAEYRKEQTHA